MASLLKEKGLSYTDIYDFEYNEAFAVISAHFRKKHPEVADRLNRWGGALAYGHPYGVSGAEIMIHLMKILETEGETSAWRRSRCRPSSPTAATST